MKKRTNLLAIFHIVVLNIGAVSLLALLLTSPMVVSKKLVRYTPFKELVLGNTDVLDYGNLVKVESGNNQAEILKIKYVAFANKPTIYENVAFVKNQGGLPKRLKIMFQNQDAQLYFNVGRADGPTTISLAKDQTVLVSLSVQPVENGITSEEREADFAIISF